MTNGNNKKKKQLGIPYGTAIGRLRKMIMFDLVKRLKKNFCYQCKKKINSIDEFSIEHKKPWIDNNVDLFWDLKNIAFSHLSCNVGAARSYMLTQKKHPNISSYINGCRCDECKALNSAREHKRRIYGKRKKILDNLGHPLRSS